jgi:hypothetical protein
MSQDNGSVRNFARLRMFLWILYGLWVFAILPLAIVAITLETQQPHLYRIVGIFVITNLLASGALQWILAFWPCPHCGRAFFGGWRSDASLRFFTINDRRCVNCGSAWPQRLLW